MPPLFGRGGEPRSEEQRYKRLEELQSNLDEQYRNQMSEINELREKNAQLRERVATLSTLLDNLRANSRRAFFASLLALFLSSGGVGLVVNYLTGDEKEILIPVVGGTMILSSLLIEWLAYNLRS